MILSNEEKKIDKTKKKGGKILLGLLCIIASIILVEGTLMMDELQGFLTSIITSKDYDINIIIMEVILIVASISVFYITMTIRDFEKKVLIIISIIVMNFGIIGYIATDILTGMEINALTTINSIYQTIQLFVMEYTEPINVPISIQVARFLALIVAAGTIILLVAKEKLRNLIIKLVYRQHVVICCDDMEEYIFEIARSTKQKVIIAYYNQHMLKNLSEDYKKRFTLIEIKKEDNFVRKVKISQCKKIFLLRNQAVDNIILANECYECCKLHKKEQKPKVICYIRYNNEDEFNLYTKHLLFTDIQDRLITRCINLQQLVARNVIYKYSPISLMEKHNESCTLEELSEISIGIMGEGKLLKAMLYENALNAHYNKNDKIKMTYYHTGFIRRLIKKPYDQIIELDTINILGEDEMINIQKINNHVIYLCYHNATKALKELKLLLHFFEHYDASKANRYSQIVLVIEDDKIEYDLLKTHIQIINDKTNEKNSDSNNMLKFPWEIQIQSLHELIGKLEAVYDGSNAKKMHEIYKKCYKNDDEDFNWEKLSETQKELNYVMVKHCTQIKLPIWKILKKDSLMEEEEVYKIFAEMEHNRWKAQKLLQGYAYFHKRDDDLLLNEKLLPYSELDENQSEENSKYIKDAMDILIK